LILSASLSKSRSLEIGTCFAGPEAISGGIADLRHYPMPSSARRQSDAQFTRPCLQAKHDSFVTRAFVLHTTCRLMSLKDHWTTSEGDMACCLMWYRFETLTQQCPERLSGTSTEMLNSTGDLDMGAFATSSKEEATQTSDRPTCGLLGSHLRERKFLPCRTGRACIQRDDNRRRKKMFARLQIERLESWLARVVLLSRVTLFHGEGRGSHENQ
jgi:hypothetical protein